MNSDKFSFFDILSPWLSLSRNSDWREMDENCFHWFYLRGLIFLFGNWWKFRSWTWLLPLESSPGQWIRYFSSQTDGVSLQCELGVLHVVDNIWILNCLCSCKWEKPHLEKILCKSVKGALGLWATIRHQNCFLTPSPVFCTPLHITFWWNFSSFLYWNPLIAVKFPSSNLHSET